MDSRTGRASRRCAFSDTFKSLSQSTLSLNTWRGAQSLERFEKLQHDFSKRIQADVLTKRSVDGQLCP
jgi:hypothetical protein